MANFTLIIPTMVVFPEPTFVTFTNTVESDVGLYSPIIGNNKWRRGTRLFILIFSSILGTTSNGFFVSSFFINGTIKWNIFLACIGFADLIITAVVLPTSSLVLMSGQWDNIITCKFIQTAVQTSTYSFNILFACLSLESFCRICNFRQTKSLLSSMHISVIVILIFVGSTSISAAGVYLELDYDYCSRAYKGNPVFRLITAIIMLGLPGILTITCSLISLYIICRRGLMHPQYERSQHYKYNRLVITINVVTYLFFSLAWFPYFIIVNKYPTTSDSLFYDYAYLGIFRSTINGLSYGCSIPVFQKAYCDLIDYCFCKNSLDNPSPRHRRDLELIATPSGEIRVHILQQAIPSTSNTRCTCETYNL